MPLPQQAAEKLVRRPVHTQGAYRQLVLFSAALFLIALAVYAGLVFGYTPYLSGRADVLDEEIRAFGEEIPLEEQQKIVSFYSALVNLRTLLGAHARLSPAFALLEEDTQSSVYWTRASLDAPRREISLQGLADTENTIASQIATFENDPRIEQVNFEDASLREGEGWQFTARIHLVPSALNLSP